MKRRYLAGFLLTLLLFLTGCSGISGTEEREEGTGQEGTALKVYYLDVGQADCTILQSGDSAMIIDAGNNDDEEYILSYLKQLGISRLEYAVGTHSHEDHIGSMDSVLKEFDVDTLFLPEEESKTKTYRDVLDAVSETGTELERPAVGKDYQFGEAEFTILAPEQGEYSDPNAYSIGLLVTYGKNKFLFTGDAPEESEKAMLQTGIDLEADVFQAGHHGSSTSNCEDFLKEVDPVYAVISCGAENKYGHPHAEVLARLEDMDVQVYRTDLQGTLTAESDGSSIRWSVEANEESLENTSENTKENISEKDQAQNYIINQSTGKFHFPECSSVEEIKPENRLEETGSREELIGEGYQPCGRCKP